MSHEFPIPEPQLNDAAQLSRRSFLAGVGLTVGSLLAGCGSSTENSSSATDGRPSAANQAPNPDDPLDFSSMPDGPIPAIWNYDLDPLTPTYNKEAQTYDNKHARIEDGILVIQGIKTATGYESSRINTLGNFSFTFGTLTARVMLPEGVGTWPALWLLPDEKDTPRILKKYDLPDKPQEDDLYYVYGGEIDFVEATGADGPINQPAAHTYKTRSEGAGGIDSFTTKPIKDAYTAFHDYGLNKTPGKLEFTLDGKVINTIEKQPGDSLKEWPYDDYKYYGVINLAFGGDWAGRLRDDFPPNGIDDSKSPWELRIASLSFTPAA